MRFLFSCGGTAGHINPALAVAGRLKEAVPGAEFLFIGAQGRMETDLVPRAGYEIRPVKITNVSRGLKPKDIAHNLGTMKNIVGSLTESKRIIKEFKPDVAVGTGGYVCFPVLHAASKLGVPTLVHESNAVPGLTTKVLEGTVDRIMVGFEDSRRNYKNPERVMVTGTPVRREFINLDREKARQVVMGDTKRPLVVSVWGSLGASAMNMRMAEFFANACEHDTMNVIHSSGEAGYGRMTEKLKELCPDYADKGLEVRPYIYDMPQVMAAADLIICRGGASTLAELTAMGKPAILVPSPNVTNNHQEKNARVLERAGGAKVIVESELRTDELYDMVWQLVQSPERLKKMSESMRSLFVEDATERICETVLDLAESGKKS